MSEFAFDVSLDEFETKVLNQADTVPHGDLAAILPDLIKLLACAAVALAAAIRLNRRHSS